MNYRIVARSDYVLAWLVFGCLAHPPMICADTPSAAYIFPAGGQRGTTVKFQVGGHYFHGQANLELRGTGLAVTPQVHEGPTRWFEGPLVVKPASQASENYPRDHQGAVTIAAEAPLGLVPWRVWTSQGATTSRPFVIGSFPEFVEDEVDGRAIPETVSLPVTINGRMFPREDVDIWTFEALKGQQITCEVLAARIASPLDPFLEVRGPGGERIVGNDDHHGADSWLRFTAPRSGAYQVHIWDTDFRGLQDFVYRLSITAGPYVDCTFPLGGRRGERLQFSLYGQNLPNSPVAAVVPTNSQEQVLFAIPGVHSALNSIPIEGGDLYEAVEGSTDILDCPIELNGCIRVPGEVDYWRIRGRQGEPIQYELRSAQLGSQLDGVIEWFNEEGKSLHSSGSSNENRVEPKGVFTAPSNGVYTLTVRDVLGSRGDHRFGYRLRLSAPSPDFQLRMAADALTVMRRGEGKLKVTAERLGGFNGKIKIAVRPLDPKVNADSEHKADTANGLPVGVTLANDVIPEGKSEVELVFKAEGTAPVGASLVILEGTAELGDMPVTRRATSTAASTSLQTDSLLLLVGMPTPFSFDGGEFQLRYGARGTIFRRKYTLIRNDYAGPLTIRLADRQIRHLQGVTGEVLELRADTKEFEYAVRLPTWLETNRTCRVTLMAVGEVTDELGRTHKVSFSSGETRNQVALLTAPCPLSVRADRASLLAAKNGEHALNVFIGRGTLPAAPVTLSLLPQPHVRGVTASPIVIPADADRGIVQIRFSDLAGPFTMPLTIRATTHHQGDEVVAETKIEFVTDP